VEGAGVKESEAVGRGGRMEADAGVGEQPRGHVGEGDLQGLLEAQARHLHALGEAVQAVLESQRVQAEKLNKILEALNQMNKLLEHQTRLLEQALKPRKPVPETEPQNQQPSKPETQQPQSCVEIQLDEPPGETACLPPQAAQRAQKLKARGYRLIKTGNHLYAEKHRRKTPIV
jgi:hypothetical protein